MTLRCSEDIMPAPFAWIDIAGGMGTVHTQHGKTPLVKPAHAYRMAKYPVTNRQYAEFVQAGGYTTERWWTPAGWEARLQGWVYVRGHGHQIGSAWTEPLYWHDVERNDAEQPVVGVSWFEAVAYCLWLSDVTGESIMLPSQEQWQYAAQGEEGRIFPWGNEWDAARCNNSVKPNASRRASPVRQYEGLGDSLLGLVDMAGNVCEWCTTEMESPSIYFEGNAGMRTIRDGAYYMDFIDGFRNDHAAMTATEGRSTTTGFRLCSKPKTDS
jgi:formylglycine-generating enzyme required for sulfatase activity